MLHIDLSGKTALVTGGARGIGRAISRTLASAGAAVWVHYARSEKQADTLCEEIRSSGGVARSVQADVSQPDEVKQMVDYVLNETENVDILVNNAGITSVKAFLELTPEEWDRILGVNLDGPFLCCQHFLPHMVERGSGVIVNISSTSAITGGGGGAHYAASKSALDSLTRALAREYAPRGIRINGIAPTMIESDFLEERYPDPAQRAEMASRIPVGRLGRPSDVAYMVAVLCAPMGSYLSGETIVMDGGRTFA